MKIFTHFKNFLKDDRGASMVEFVLILPVLMTISLGIYETTNYVLVSAKLNEISSGIANWVSAETSTATITDCLIGANLIGTNYNFSKYGTVVVSGLQRVGTSTSQKLVWQQASAGGSSQMSTNSSTGVVQSAPFTIASEANLIVVEVTFKYQPTFSYFLSVFPSVTLLKVAQTVPRGSGTFNPLPAV